MDAATLDRHFPRYTKFSPHVPVWCVTPDEGRAIHRFFDTSPFSPSGRYVAVFRLPFEDRRPAPGDTGRVCVIDLDTGEDRTVAETRGWEPQLGANVNWGADDRTLLFNDVDTDTWLPFAWRLDPQTGERRRLGGCVYHASPDGRWLVAGNPVTMGRTQYGYGVVIPPDRVPRRVGLPTDDGFFLTDTVTGDRRMLISVRSMVEQSGLDVGDPGGIEIYPFHSKFSPQGDRLILTLRWFVSDGQPHWDTLMKGPWPRFAVFTIRPDGTGLRLAVGPERWRHGGHHINFFPDGQRLSMNLAFDGTRALAFTQCGLGGEDLRPIRDDLVGSGHPTLHPDGRHLLTDTYDDESTAFGDGTVPLRWVDLHTGAVRNVVRIHAAQPAPDRTMRVDPHPAWDRTWQFVAFNAFEDGTRRVYVADFRRLLSQ